MAAQSRPSGSTHVLDSSAILALLLDEPGADAVYAAGPGGIVSAVNLSEVVAKMLDRGSSLDPVLTRLDRLAFNVAAFDARRARDAGALRSLTRDSNVSFADRACLSLAVEMGLPVLTGDREWTTLNIEAEIRLIR